MKVFYHDDCLLHNPPYEILSGKLVPYFEKPARIEMIKQALLEDGGFELINELIDDFDLEECILRVHTVDYLKYLKTAYDLWVEAGGSKESVLPDTFPHLSLLEKRPDNLKNLNPIASAGLYCYDLSCPITIDTFKAALASLQVVLTAAEELRSLQHSEGVFALCRPPGHHAMPSLSGGYCFINNVAIAVRFLQDGATSDRTMRVAVLDIDYHHGNGTQNVFYRDSSVLYVSLHAENDYPYFTGSVEETGEGEGQNFNTNFPLPRGSTGDDEYCSTLIRATSLVQEFDPEYLIVSLGVDTYIDDPICEFKITTDGYTRIGQIIAGLHKCTLFVMEGGYCLEKIGINVRNVLNGFQQRAVQAY